MGRPSLSSSVPLTVWIFRQKLPCLEVAAGISFLMEEMSCGEDGRPQLSPSSLGCSLFPKQFVDNLPFREQ